MDFFKATLCESMKTNSFPAAKLTIIQMVNTE